MKKNDIVNPVGIVFLFFTLPAYGQERKSGNIQPFESYPSSFSLPVYIPEASGIADSKLNPGLLWVQEDSGNPPQLFLLGHDGKTKKTIYIKKAVNRDWEDIALAEGPVPGKKYIYIAETGDNNAVHPNVSFYRFEEPLEQTDTVEQYDIIRFIYEDGSRDAEAFLVDNISRDIYIITKREKRSRIYKLNYPYSTTDINQAFFIYELPYNGVVSAAISEEGTEILVKTYTSVFYYIKSKSESIPEAMQKEPLILDYRIEPQGEALCFSADRSGFFTLSEMRMSISQKLYFYKRK